MSTTLKPPNAMPFSSTARTWPSNCDPRTSAATRAAAFRPSLRDRPEITPSSRVRAQTAPDQQHARAAAPRRTGRRRNRRRWSDARAGRPAGSRRALDLEVERVFGNGSFASVKCHHSAS
jgi:hypothetical protein